MKILKPHFHFLPLNDHIWDGSDVAVYTRPILLDPFDAEAAKAMLSTKFAPAIETPFENVVIYIKIHISIQWFFRLYSLVYYHRVFDAANGCCDLAVTLMNWHNYYYLLRWHCCWHLYVDFHQRLWVVNGYLVQSLSYVPVVYPQRNFVIRHPLSCSKMYANEDSGGRWSRGCLPLRPFVSINWKRKSFTRLPIYCRYLCGLQ